MQNTRAWSEGEEQTVFQNAYLESVGPAAAAGLLELASLGAHVRLDGVVGVQVVDAEYTS